MPRQQPTDPGVKEASRLIRAGRSRQAIPLLDAYIGTHGPCLWALLERGRAKQFTADLTGAIADFSEAIYRWPTDVQGFTHRAVARRTAGDLKGAIQDYSAAIALDEAHPVARFQRGRTRVALGDFTGALGDFTWHIMNAKAGSISGLLNRGVLRHRIGDLDGAERDLTAALGLRPDDVYAPLYRARVRTSRQDWRGALADYALALASQPSLSNAYRERAELRRTLGDEPGALADESAYRRLGGKDLAAFK